MCGDDAAVPAIARVADPNNPKKPCLFAFGLVLPLNSQRIFTGKGFDATVASLSRYVREYRASTGLGGDTEEEFEEIKGGVETALQEYHHAIKPSVIGGLVPELAAATWMCRRAAWDVGFPVPTSSTTHYIFYPVDVPDSEAGVEHVTDARKIREKHSNAYRKLKRNVQAARDSRNRDTGDATPHSYPLSPADIGDESPPATVKVAPDICARVVGGIRVHEVDSLFKLQGFVNSFYEILLPEKQRSRARGAGRGRGRKKKTNKKKGDNESAPNPSKNSGEGGKGGKGPNEADTREGKRETGKKPSRRRRRKPKADSHNSDSHK